MQWRRRSSAGASSPSFEALEPRVLLTGQPLITEFLALNDSGLTDEDGAFSDWIEIHNPSRSSVDLTDWGLTDDEGEEPDVWRFREVTLAPGEYRIVFASGEDRRDPAGELHTSFRLGGGGEYLALLNPAGEVIQEFDPFPPQTEDVSYGVRFDMVSDTVIGQGSAATYLVPTNGSLGTSWTEADFDDASWSSGTLGAGYQQTVPGFAVTSYKANVQVSHLTVAEGVIANPSQQTAVHTETAAVLNYQNDDADGHYGANEPFPGIPGDSNDFVIEATGLVMIPSPGAWTFGVNSDDGFGLVLDNGTQQYSMSYPDPRGSNDTIQTFNVAQAGEYALRLVYYEQGGGAQVELFAAPGTRATFDAAAFDLVGDTASGGLSVYSTPVAGSGGSYGGLIETDLGGAMHGTNASVYLRSEFAAEHTSEYADLLLRMKYDDGFVGYLNGVEVARRNAPAVFGWDSAATAGHGPGTSSFLRQDFDAAGAWYTTSWYGNPPEPQILSAGPDGSFLRLTHNGATDNINRISFDAVHDGPASQVTADFDFRCTGGSPADGFSFLLLPTSLFGSAGPGSDDTYHSEEPSLADTFAVGFDLYPAGSTNDVSVHWNGSEVLNVTVPEAGADLDAGVFHHAHVRLVADEGGSRATVILTPDILGAPGPAVTVIDDLFLPGLAPYESRVEFSARTGALSCSIDLDNIEVASVSPGAAIEFEDIDLSGYLHLLQPEGNVLALHGLNVEAADGDFLILPELIASGEATIHADELEFYSTPTPGYPNAAGFAAAAETPEFSHEAGTFASSFELELTAEAPDAVIRYTLDGSVPTESSTPYQGPMPISATTRVRARTYQEGLSPSTVVSQAYVALSPEVVNFTSNLPLVIVENFAAGGVPSDHFQPAFLAIIEPGEARSSLTASVDLQTRIGLKTRGSSTAGRPKKTYAFEAWDEQDEDKDVSVLGMSAESDWILYGPYNFDRALIRNAFIYGLSSQIERYAVRCKFVEVFVNTDGGALVGSDYHGVYVLMEKIKRDGDRLDLEPLAPADAEEPEVTGGYILKIDRRDPGDSGFYAGDQSLNFVEPKEEEISAAQRDYLTNYLNEFAAVLRSNDFDDPETGYAQYIDVMSWIDHNLLNMLAMNVDAFRLSAYFFKERGGKLEAGPIWDFDRSMESTDGRDDNPTAWNGTGDSSLYVEPDARYWWWGRLFEDPDFWQAYKDRWYELRRDQFSIENIHGVIDSMAAELQEAQARNFARWPEVTPRNSSFQWEIDHLKWWLETRILWVDQQFGPMPILSRDGGAVDPGFELMMGASAGTIYYTLDGSDPRLPGGGVRPGAGAIGTGSESTTFVEKGSWWHYLDAGAYAGDGWTELTFPDGQAPWKYGRAELGYGDGNEATQVSYGPDSNDKYPTTYFRHRFTVEGAAEVTDLTLGLMRDDGAVAYVNGHALPPSNMPGDEITYDTWASSAIGGGAESTFYQYVVDPAWLVEGDNILAVEVHQANATSSDVSFDLWLRGTKLTQQGHQGVAIDETLVVTARTLVGDQWSPPREAIFETGEAAELALTEIHYHPHWPSEAEIAAGFLNDDDFEFVEIRNIGTQTLNVSSLRFTDGIDFRFGGSAVTRLAPGEYVLAVSNLKAFEYRYGTGLPVAGAYTGSLNNDGEVAGLTYGVGTVLFDFAYNDAGAWPGRADGNGSSLELSDPIGTAGDAYADSESWRSSLDYDGSPGGAGSTLVPGIVINEVLTHTDPPLYDAIELHNITDEAIDLSGWYLSDSNHLFHKFRIPDGTILADGAYLVFDETSFNPSVGADPQDFALNSAHGDDVWLLEADAAGRLLRFVDHAEFGAAVNGESFGRWPDGTGPLYPMAERTLSEPNSGPRVGPLIVSEIHYNPAEPADPDLTAEDLAFVEVHNPTDGSIELTEWRLRKGISYNFAPEAVLPPHSTVVVLSFDPDLAANAERLAAFRATYGIDDQVMLVGGYTGQLDNGGERVQLQRPDEPPPDERTFYPRLLEDEADYDDDDPWSASADGNGASLHRLAADLWGLNASHWGPGTPTPGRLTSPPPTVAGVSRAEGDPLWRLTEVVVRFSQDVSAGASREDIQLRNDATGQVMDLSTAAFEYDAATNTGRWHLAGAPVETGLYTVSVWSDGVANTVGVGLDGDGDGTAGGDYQTMLAVAVPGDADLSGSVDFLDYLAVKGGFGTSSGAEWARGDFDLDGDVDLADYLAGEDHFGQTFDSGAAEVLASPAPGPARTATAPAPGGEPEAHDGAAEDLLAQAANLLDPRTPSAPIPPAADPPAEGETPIALLEPSDGAAGVPAGELLRLPPQPAPLEAAAADAPADPQFSALPDDLPDALSLSAVLRLPL